LFPTRGSGGSGSGGGGGGGSSTRAVRQRDRVSTIYK